MTIENDVNKDILLALFNGITALCYSIIII